MGESSGREICRILLVDESQAAHGRRGAACSPRTPICVWRAWPLSGGEAVALAASLAPQIVIMDLGMPGMNGVDASRAVLPGAAAGADSDLYRP